MLVKCANPLCAAPFRKLGKGKLFAFESVTIAKSVDSGISGAARTRSPVFFWLCESCSPSFTVGLDASGQPILQRVPDGVEVTIFDGRRLNRAG